MPKNKECSFIDHVDNVLWMIDDYIEGLDHKDYIMESIIISLKESKKNYYEYIKEYGASQVDLMYQSIQFMSNEIQPMIEALTKVKPLDGGVDGGL